MPLSAIVMAAGSSDRMGRPKLLLPYRDGTILDATVAAVVSAPVDRVIVATGADAEAVEASLRDLPVTIVRNPDPRRGTMSSLLAAAEADPAAGAFVKVPGDQPEVSPVALAAIADAWHRREAWAAVATYRDRIAHPFLVSRPALAEAARLEGSKVLWRTLVDSGDPRVERIPVDGDAPLDVNTEADYVALVERDR